MDLGDVPIPENGHKSKLPHHRQKILDNASSAEWSRRHANDSHSFVDVLFEVCVENMFEQPRISVVVFRRDDDECIRAIALGRELGILDILPRSVYRQRDFPNVNQFGLNAGKIRQLVYDEVGHMLAHAPLAYGAKDDGDEEWTTFVHVDLFQSINRKKIRKRNHET